MSNTKSLRFNVHLLMISLLLLLCNHFSLVSTISGESNNGQLLLPLSSFSSSSLPFSNSQESSVNPLLLRYANLYHQSTKPLGDFLFRLLPVSSPLFRSSSPPAAANAKNPFLMRFGVSLQRTLEDMPQEKQAKDRLEEQKQKHQKVSTDQKLMSWIQKHNLKPVMLMTSPQVDKLESEAGKDETSNRIKPSVRLTSNAAYEDTKDWTEMRTTPAKREVNLANCKPLKQQFMDVRDDIFKKGDSTFQNLRNFFAHCYNNDGIRF